MSLSPWGGGSISPSAAHAPARPLHCICAQASEAKGRATWSPAGRAGQRPCSVLGWSPFLQRGPRGLDHVERGLVAWSLADLGLGSLAANLGPGLSGSGLHSGSFLLCVRPLDAPSASLSLRFLTCEVQRLPTLCTAPPPALLHLQPCLRSSAAVSPPSGSPPLPPCPPTALGLTGAALALFLSEALWMLRGKHGLWARVNSLNIFE